MCLCGVVWCGVCVYVQGFHRDLATNHPDLSRVREQSFSLFFSFNTNRFEFRPTTPK